MENVLTKDKTQIIKGIAILLMIAHHCLIKEFYLTPPDYVNSFAATSLQTGAKMCVGLFTFFIGYGCFFAQRIDFKYISQHVWRLLKQYWIVLFVTILIVLFSCSKGLLLIISERSTGGGNLLLLNMFGVNQHYNLGNWYIYFYIYALAVMPLFMKLMRTKLWVKTAIVIIICGLMSIFIHGDNQALQAIINCIKYTPILIMGYACAKSQIFDLIVSRIKSRYVWLVVALVAFALRCYATSVKGFVTDIVFVPIIIVAVSAMFVGKENGVISKVLVMLGSNSTLMWFVHALPFSDATRSIFQTSPLWVNNVIVLYLCITTISFIIAYLGNMMFYKLGIIQKR